VDKKVKSHKERPSKPTLQKAGSNLSEFEKLELGEEDDAGKLSMID
jgi:hypothetical protein